MNKKIIVLENNAGRMANQLWHFASMYAYCLEKGYVCENWAFFRYVHYFNFSIKNKIVDLIFVRFFKLHKSIKLTKALYILFSKIVQKLFRKKIVRDNNVVFFLPPTPNMKEEQKEKLRLIDKLDLTWYFCGWLFRNPDGQKKYHAQIQEYFKPREPWGNMVQNFITNLKNKYKLVVGVHIRQGDYRTWEGGQYYFTCAEVRTILNNFILNYRNLRVADTVFVICSDEKIDEKYFAGLNFVFGPGSEITDLYTLAATDLIIGSTSTYGSWAAYYGEKPFIKFSRDKIDWTVLNKI